jgi:glycosyltransferase involved in cell wall biosynthesis
MNTPLRVLMVTSEWPTPEHPEWAPFVVQQVKFLRLAGMEVDVFPFHGARNPFNYIRAWVQVQRRLRRKRYDLAHAQFGQSGSLVIPKRVPVVVTFHGSDLEGIVGPKGRYTFQGYVLNLLSRMVASLADEIIVVSASLARRLPRRIRRHKRYHIIPGGVDLELFKPSPKQEARDALKLPHDCLLILFGGTPHVARKRYELARQAVHHLSGGCGVELIVPRNVPHHIMPLYMNACDVLLLTSIHEGSPTVVKEALACNLPVVSVAVGDVPELIGGVPGCVICQDVRAKTIAAALADVLGRCESFSSRDLAEKQLDERLQVEKVINIYRHWCRPNFRT